MNWENLKKNNLSTKLNRKPEIQKAYDNDKKKYNGDYNKHLLNIYLDNRLYNLQLNKFPYDLEKNIIHCVLWLNPIIQESFIHNRKFIYTILKKYIPDKPFLFHMNLSQNRSVKSIPHYQVFIKMN